MTNDQLESMLDAAAQRERPADRAKPVPAAFTAAVRRRRGTRTMALAAMLATPVAAMILLAVFWSRPPAPLGAAPSAFTGAPTAGRLRALNADRDVDHMLLPAPAQSDGTDIRRELPRGASAQPSR